MKYGTARGDFFEGADPQDLAVTEQALGALVSEGVVYVTLHVPDLKLHNNATGSTLVMFEMEQSLPASAKAQGLTMDALLAGVRSPDVDLLLSRQLGRGRVTATAYAAAQARRQKLQTAYKCWWVLAQAARPIWPHVCWPSASRTNWVALWWLKTASVRVDASPLKP